MTVTKADLQANTPTSNSIIQVASGEVVYADTENSNNNSLLSASQILFNYCIDQTPQTTVASSYSALQTYNVDNGTNPDIAVNKITSAITNGNIDLDPNGTGLATYNSQEIATQPYVANALAAAATITGIVMTGATAGTPGTAGAVPAPAAGENDEAFFGDGTYKKVNTTVVPTAAKTGNGNKFVTAHVAGPSGNVTMFDASGDLVDSGVTAASLTGVNTVIRKTTNQTVTNTTYTSDNTLTYAMSANKNYWFRFNIPFSADAAQGAKFQLLFSASVTNWSCTYVGNNNATTALVSGSRVGRTTTAAITTSAGIGTTEGNFLQIEGVIQVGGSASTMTLQFAENSGLGAGVVVYGGSTLSIREIS